MCLTYRGCSGATAVSRWPPGRGLASAAVAEWQHFPRIPENRNIVNTYGAGKSTPRRGERIKSQHLDFESRSVLSSDELKMNTGEHVLGGNLGSRSGESAKPKVRKFKIPSIGQFCWYGPHFPFDPILNCELCSIWLPSRSTPISQNVRFHHFRPKYAGVLPILRVFFVSYETAHEKGTTKKNVVLHAP